MALNIRALQCLHGLHVYAAKPPKDRTPKGIMAMVPAVFGWEFVINRLLCDNYAWKEDFYVLIPGREWQVKIFLL